MQTTFNTFDKSPIFEHSKQGPRGNFQKLTDQYQGPRCQPRPSSSQEPREVTSQPPLRSFGCILIALPGIGLAVAKYLLTAPQAHNVVVVARSIEPLQKLKEQYTKQVEVVNGDLADFSLAQKAVDAALKTFGQLDGMVLNHGILGQVGKVAEADTEQWRQGFDVNFFSLVAFVCDRLPSCSLHR